MTSSSRGEARPPRRPAHLPQPILDIAVGDALRDAAAEAPHTTALVEGAADPANRRRWTYAELLEAWGEQVAAFVRAPRGRPDARPRRAVAYCRGHLAPHKTPRHWTVLDEFPLTPEAR